MIFPISCLSTNPKHKSRQGSVTENTEKKIQQKQGVVTDIKGIHIIKLSGRDFKIKIIVCVRKENGIDAFDIVVGDDINRKDLSGIFELKLK